VLAHIARQDAQAVWVARRREGAAESITGRRVPRLQLRISLQQRLREPPGALQRHRHQQQHRHERPHQP